MNTTENSIAGSIKGEPNREKQDRLLTFRDVYSLLGYRCQTGHTARALTASGKIREVRINGRVIRYSENSVKALIAGGAA